MKFIIEINCTGDAFEVEGELDITARNVQVANILEFQVNNRLDKNQLNDSLALKDTNGNTVGTARYEA